MKTNPVIRAILWVEGKSDSLLTHLWTVPNVGDKLHDEYSEESFVVTEVHHYINMGTRPQTFPDREEPECHLKIKARKA